MVPTNVHRTDTYGVSSGEIRAICAVIKYKGKHSIEFTEEVVFVLQIEGDDTLAIALGYKLVAIKVLTELFVVVNFSIYA